MSGPGRQPAGTDLSGSRVGSYEILSFLGSGGMGEVYRARDEKLGRDVALKVLPTTLSETGDRRRRFEQEARAASALNHPNIVTIYDIGISDSVSYIAMELISGRTLRELCRSGPLPTKKLLDVAGQIAQGLARAHAAGIVHRDLKPENVMVSEDGVVKILDFGLAKLVPLPVERGAGSEEPTATVGTEPGILLGTYGYMSPEQASGRTVDFRSDQFSFGSILYEMATGKKAFQRSEAVDTLSAILHDEPEPIEQINVRIPTPLRWVVDRCLAKDPKDRYASTEDLARELSDLREHLSDLSSVPGAVLAAKPRRRFGVLLAVFFALASLAFAYLLGVRRTPTPSSLRFQQLTFRSAGIDSARFAPDGHTVVYTAQWEGKPVELFTTRTESPESRSLGLTRASLLSISATAKMAVRLEHPWAPALRIPHSYMTMRDPELLVGTLAELPLAGGAPRELLENVRAADWAPDGKTFAVTRFAGGKDWIEYPPGKSLPATATWLFHPRVSPDGERVAFADGSRLKTLDRSGRVHDFERSVSEIAWSPRTDEVWFSLARLPGRPRGSTTEILAATPSGRIRKVVELPGDFALYDIAADGRVLVARIVESSEILASFPGEARERNLSWFDRSIALDLSSSGDTLLFNEMGTADAGGLYLRRTDGSEPKRIGEGFLAALSQDGKWVVSYSERAHKLTLVPAGPGPPRPIDLGDVVPGGRVGFFPDGKRIFCMGSAKSHPRRLYVHDLQTGATRPISPEGMRRPVISRDGRFVCGRAVGGDFFLYPTEPGEAKKVQGLQRGEEPTQWTEDGLLYVRGNDEPSGAEGLITAKVYRLDPSTGRRVLWKEIPPVSNLAGGAISNILFSADGKICVYTHHRYSSDLFLVQGLR